MTIYDSEINQAEQLRLFYNNQNPSFQEEARVYVLVSFKEIQCKDSEKNA